MSKLSAIVAAAVLLCGLSGYAVAQSGSATPKTVKACAKKKGGALRLGKCRKGERRVTWAAKGPSGRTGPTGPPGAPGAAGANGARGLPAATARTGPAAPPPARRSSPPPEPAATLAAAVPATRCRAGGRASRSPPAGSYAQVIASVTAQRTSGTADTACVRVDATDVQFSASTSLVPETRHLQQGSAAGTDRPACRAPAHGPAERGIPHDQHALRVVRRRLDLLQSQPLRHGLPPDAVALPARLAVLSP